MAASMRISSQVWPIWLPRAVARAEKKMLIAKLSSTISKQQINPLLFSATFRSLLSQTQSAEWNTTSRSFNPSKRCQIPSRQQIRAFSTSSTSPPPIQHSHEESTATSWVPPTDVHKRPVTIIGAGVLGRRLATLVPPQSLSPSSLQASS
jgi:hypothetical protein